MARRGKHGAKNSTYFASADESARTTRATRGRSSRSAVVHQEAEVAQVLASRLGHTYGEESAASKSRRGEGGGSSAGVGGT